MYSDAEMPFLGPTTCGIQLAFIIGLKPKKLAQIAAETINTGPIREETPRNHSIKDPRITRQMPRKRRRGADNINQ